MGKLRRCVVFGLMLGCVAAIGLGGTASAADPSYPLGAPVITVVVVTGSTVNVSGSGWAPGDVVTVTVFSNSVTLGTITVGSNGSFSTNFEIPCSIGNGAHTVTATGASGTASTAITVSNCAVSAAALAFTGSSSSGPFTGIGVVLLLAGTVFVVMARRRRTANTIKV